MEYKHAKDYLKDFFKDKEDWLKCLVTEAINTNADISQDRLDEIYDSLLNGTKIETVQNDYISDKPKEKLLIKSLNHKCGVNSLAENQKINLSDNITVVYGLNGSGKSGYFRILNEICGGNQEKEILQNVYEEEPKDIEVCIEYLLDGKEKTLAWDNSVRALDNFNEAHVFDSSYLNGLLSKRETDSYVLYPLGLHLFAYLSDTIDAYSNNIQQIISEKKYELPNIDTSCFSEELKDVFDNRKSFSKTQRKSIEANYIFAEDKDKELISKENELQALKQSNITDKVNLAIKNINEIKNVVDKIDYAQKMIRDYSERLIKLYSEKDSLVKKNNHAIKSLKLLKNIPNTDSDEWKSFIKSGYAYQKSLQDVKNDTCPYCRQKLETDIAKQILEAYEIYLSDESQKELLECEENVKYIKEKVSQIILDVSLPDDIINLIITKHEDFDSGIFNNNIKSIKDNVNTLKTSNNISDIKLHDVDLTKELKIFGSFSKELKEKVDLLKDDNNTREDKVAELIKEVCKLKENKSISSQEKSISKYFKIHDEISRLEELKKQTNTRDLTILSNNVQNELLTKKLELNFANELEAIGKKSLKVKLNVKKGSKGRSVTQLTLLSKDPQYGTLKKVLSEGEQKSIALAMFFSEIQSEDYPIILDDPVNSLDHEIAGKVASRLMEFNNQVIVFTHNRLFLGGFENSKDNHVCKNDISCCKKKGKHVLMQEVYAYSQNKGILRGFQQKSSNALIDKAEKKLSKVPFDETDEVCINIRKAIEMIIDEDVFLNQLPPKVSNKNSRINWDSLKDVNSHPDLIDELHYVHDRVSSQDHDGTDSLENEITVDELQELLGKLKNIKNKFKEVKNSCQN